MEISTTLLRWETRVAPLLRETRESQRRWVEERHVGVSGALPNIFGLDLKKKWSEACLAKSNRSEDFALSLIISKTSSMAALEMLGDCML